MKVMTFSIKNLRMDEDFGFHKQVETLLPLLASESGLQRFVNEYNVALVEFDDALKLNGTAKLTKAVEDADKRTDVAWSGINNFVKAMKTYPDEEIREIANEVREIMKKYGNITILPYNEQYGAMHNLLQDFDNLGVEKQIKAFLNGWIEEMKLGYDAYMKATSDRTKVESVRVAGNTKEKRNATDKAYKSLCDAVNAFVTINGEDNYKEFVSQLNVFVDKAKSTLAARSSRNKKEKEDITL